MSNQKSSYRKVMQATSIFGGVQVFTVLFSLLKSKFIAVILGPSGMGIMGLFASTISLISLLTNFGINSVAVKNISEANATNNSHQLLKTVSVVKKWVLFTGFLGMFLTIILSPILSKLVFQNYEYSLSFILLSITLFLSQVSQGQLVFLQGIQRIKDLAKANIFAIIISFFVSVPIYYFYKLEGIVPALIVTSVTGFLTINYFYRKNKINTKIQLSTSEIFTEGKAMAKMGIIFSLTIFITEALTYILRLYLSKTGGLADVGFYSAGFTIITSYVGIVFSAMGTDYFPRLSAVANDNKVTTQLINQQAELSLLLLSPIIIIFIVFVKYIVVIIYSNQFLVISNMLQWAIIGIIFKAISWCMAFLFLAKSNSKLFFWSELIACVYMLVFNVLGYYFYKLDGLGISFLIGYFFYMIQVYILIKNKYNFIITKDLLTISLLVLTISITCLIIQKTIPAPYNLIIGVFFIIFQIIYSLVELDKRLDLKEIFIIFKNKFITK